MTKWALVAVLLASGCGGDGGTAGNGADGGKWPGPCTIEVRDQPDNDGTVDYRQTLTYDANGNLLTDEEDFGADGTVSERRTYTYDANGNLLTEEWDRRADGTVDGRYTYTYSCWE